jgi:hypothetical protein
MIGPIEQRVMEWVARVDPEHESLYGDLLEEVTGGRSHAWFAQQLLYAGTMAAARSVWAARRTLAESLTFGCVTLAALVFSGYVTLKLGLLVVGLARIHLFASS